MAEDRVEKLKNWIIMIEEEFSEVMMTDYIFKEVREVINTNERLYTKGNHFLDYMGLSFIHSLVVGVRRQLDTSKGVISLHKLLRELDRPPTIITREYFLKFWKHKVLPLDIEMTLDLGVKAFNDIVGPDKDHLERSQIIIAYANHHITHYSDDPPLPVYPRFADLSEAIDCIYELIRKYYTLLTGTIKGEFSPTFLYDWKMIFTFPWIERVVERA